MAAVLETIPLARDGQGVWRVGGTRVTLDVVVRAFDGGAAPEEIVQRFPAPELPRFDRISPGARSGRGRVAVGPSRMVTHWAAGKAAGAACKSLRWLADENFDNLILRGVSRRATAFDFVRVQDIAGISGAGDSNDGSGDTGSVTSPATVLSGSADSECASGRRGGRGYPAAE